jgi:F0F1-type ATP synthase delta subunit
MNNSALKYIRTEAEIHKLSSLIDKILPEIYKVKGFDISKFLGEQGHETADLLKKLLEEEKIDFSNLRLTKDHLIHIKESLSSAKVVNLTIAIEPNLEMINKLSLWVKSNLGDDSVLDLKIDQSILGGAIISYEGLYKDYSLKSSLEKIFSEKRNQIAI